MKRSHLFIVACIVAAVSKQFAQAKHPPDGDGIAGKVLVVGDRWVVFDTNNFGRVKVFISLNTNFQKDGRHASAEEVKVGVGVRVSGAVMHDNIWEGWKVNVTDK